jgi:hypothetical protein
MRSQHGQNGLGVDLIDRHVADRRTEARDRCAPLFPVLLVPEALAQISENLIGECAKRRNATICLSLSDGVNPAADQSTSLQSLLPRFRQPDFRIRAKPHLAGPALPQIPEHPLPRLGRRDDKL